MTIVMYCLQIPPFSGISGVSFVLSFLPVLHLTLFLFFLTGSFVVSASLSVIAASALLIMNYFMLYYRHTSIVPRHALMYSELAGISGSFSKGLLIGVLTVMYVLVFLAVLSFKVVKNEKPAGKVRIGGLLAVIASAALLNALVYTNDMAAEGGFIASFVHALNSGKVETPKNYNEEQLLSAIGEYSANAAKTPASSFTPHIFMILGEGFSRIPFSGLLNADGAVTSGFRDVMNESAQGDIIVPNIGGGTSDTEFDILTGLSTRQFRGVPYANLIVEKQMNGLPRILKSAGYETAALHPGEGWFYKRDTVFPLLGFDSFTAIEGFDASNTKGVYVSEKETYGKTIDMFDAYIKTDSHKPLFTFLITIQNHGPYYGLYGKNVSIPGLPGGLSEKEQEALSNYLTGIADAGAELKRFTDFLNELDEPVLVVYFGDHLPLLPNAVYDALIPETDSLRLNRAPYFFWGNKRYKAEKDVSAAGEISSFYLGAAVLDEIGLASADPYFSFLNELREAAPVVLEKEYLAKDGSRHTFDGSNDGKLQTFLNWGYYKAVGGDFIDGE